MRPAADLWRVTRGLQGSWRPGLGLLVCGEDPPPPVLVLCASPEGHMGTRTSLRAAVHGVRMRDCTGDRKSVV